MRPVGELQMLDAEELVGLPETVDEHRAAGIVDGIVVEGVGEYRGVVSRPSVDVVIAGAAVERVVAAPALERVETAVPEQNVRDPVADDRFAGAIARDDADELDLRGLDGGPAAVGVQALPDMCDGTAVESREVTGRDIGGHGRIAAELFAGRVIDLKPLIGTGTPAHDEMTVSHDGQPWSELLARDEVGVDQRR